MSINLIVSQLALLQNWLNVLENDGGFIRLLSGKIFLTTC